MAKLFDADGNEVEAFNAEELKAKQDEAIATFKKAEEDRIAKETADKAASEAVAGKGEPSPLDRALSEIDSIKKQLTSSKVKEYGTKFAGNDPEKLKQFSESFGRLTGYEDSDLGFEMRAKDAAKLAFGSDTGVDIGGLSGAGTRNVDASTVAPGTPEEKALQAALGITSKDVEKFGGDKK